MEQQIIAFTSDNPILTYLILLGVVIVLIKIASH